LDESVEDLVQETTQDDATGSSVGRMRQRFHELLDDAFSLFGSRSASPGADENSSSPPTLHRVHSAIVRCVYFIMIFLGQSCVQQLEQIVEFLKVKALGMFCLSLCLTGI
jgi:hypothetical protein